MMLEGRSAYYQWPGPRLLPIIAEHADVETINILASSQPLKFSYDLRDDSIAANREVLQQRRDYSQKLSEVFEELIAIAKAEDAESQSIDSRMESGLFFSARSSFHSDLAEAMAILDSAEVSPSGTDKFEDFQEGLMTF